MRVADNSPQDQLVWPRISHSVSSGGESKI